MDLLKMSLFQNFIVKAIKNLAADNEFDVSKTFILIDYNRDSDEIFLRLYHSTDYIRDVEFEEVFKPDDIMNVGLDHMSIDDIKENLKNIIVKNVDTYSLDILITNHLLCYNGKLRIFIYVNNKYYKEIEITDLII